MLTPAQREAFFTKGFVAVPNIVDDRRQLAELRVAYDRELQSPDSRFHNLAAGVGDPVGQAPDGGGEVMLQHMNMCEVSLEFRKLLHHEQILDVAEELMGTDIMLFHDQGLYTGRNR